MRIEERKRTNKKKNRMKIWLPVLAAVLIFITVFICFILVWTKETENVFNEKKNIFTPQTGWVEEEGKWYYINEETFEKATGFIDVEGERYYLDPETGEKATGLLKLSEEEWYLLDDEGKLQRNCVVDSYVLDENGKVKRILLTEEEQKERKENLQPFIEEIAEKYGAVGASIAMIENGEVTNHWQYGYAQKDTVKMAEDTKIRIASISKVILAMNVFKFMEKGIIDLDESIGTYWGFTVQNPYYPQENVSFRTLLTHTSSIADVESYKEVEKRLEKCDIFRKVRPGDPAGWSYCNFAFGVVGSTLEKAANKSIYQICDENFFEAMGIDASFAGGRLKNTDLLATLYYADGSVSRSAELMAGFMGDDEPGKNASFMPGGLCISAVDLAKMIAILANDGVYGGTRYLEEDTVEIMETKYCSSTLHEVEVTQCIPMKYFENIYGESSLYFHTGSAYGVYSLFSYNPETKDGVIVLTTGASGGYDEYGIYSVCGKISELLYQDMAQNYK